MIGGTQFAETLLKEAQRLIPASKQDVPPVSLVQEQAARGKRKARAERISAQAALVLIGLDLGRKKDAETELRQVLAEREKLAQEEPANVDYQADLSATHILLARLHLTPEWTEIVPTAERQASLWRYTFEQPADNWACPDFDDSRWKQGPGGFGTPETPGALVGTVWNTPDIWIRRTIPTQPSISPAHLQLRVYHDDDIEIEINGQTVARLGEYTTQYKTVAPEPAALGMIRPASVLVLAAHCRNIGGGQGVDIGLSELVIKQGEFREAIAQLQTARDIWERLESTSPRRLRISHELASTFLDAAEAARKYGQTAEFDHALQAAAALSARMGSTPRGDEATVASLVRIVSSAWQSELPRARAACRDAAKVMKPVSRDKAFLELVRRAVLAVGLETPEANELLAATAGEPPPDLAEAVRLHSDQAKGFLDRADWYARRGLWKRAAADLAVANRLEPDHLGAAARPPAQLSGRDGLLPGSVSRHARSQRRRVIEYCGRKSGQDLPPAPGFPGGPGPACPPYPGGWIRLRESDRVRMVLLLQGSACIPDGEVCRRPGGVQRKPAAECRNDRRARAPRRGRPRR